MPELVTSIMVSIRRQADVGLLVVAMSATSRGSGHKGD
jgi:hypothetical protein